MRCSRRSCSPGDLLLNLSVGVSSVDLIVLCRERGALYLDTSVEPWHGQYTDASLAPAARTNYALREAALALRQPGPRRADGAAHARRQSRGSASHFVKQALLDIARDGGDASTPTDREGWALLAERLGIRVIHVAERDTQHALPRRQPGEFVNTWSVDAFIDEALQPSELGWGSHERHFPADGVRHDQGGRAAIYLHRPGASTRVRSWVPRAGAQQGFLITHAESISIAEYLTVGAGEQPRYRPTVHYAYHPSDDTVLSLHELAGRNWRAPARQRVAQGRARRRARRARRAADGAPQGRVLVRLAARRSTTRVRSARTTARPACRSPPASSRAASGRSAIPSADVVEPDELPFDEILDLARPYLGEMIGVYTDWTPLDDRAWLFSEPLDRDDPWQFVNFRVA